MKQFNSSFKHDFFLTQPVCNVIENIKIGFSFYLKVHTETSIVYYDLKKGVNIIGRDEKCHICISDPSLSRKHAMIEVISDGTIFIQDFGSINKTYRNQCELRKKVMYELTEGTNLTFGLINATILKHPESPNFDDIPDDNTHNISNNQSTDLFEIVTDKSISSLHGRNERLYHNSSKDNQLSIFKKGSHKPNSPYNYKLENRIEGTERNLSPDHEQSFEKFNKDSVESKKYRNRLKIESIPCSTSTPTRRVSMNLNSTFRQSYVQNESVSMNFNENSINIDTDHNVGWKMNESNQSVNTSNRNVGNFDDTEILEDSHTEAKNEVNTNIPDNNSRNTREPFLGLVKVDVKEKQKFNRVEFELNDSKEKEKEIQESEQNKSEEFIKGKSEDNRNKCKDKESLVNILEICDDNRTEIDEDFDVISETDLEDGEDIFSENPSDISFSENTSDMGVLGQREDKGVFLENEIGQKSIIQQETQADLNNYDDLVKGIFSEDENHIFSAESEKNIHCKNNNTESEGKSIKSETIVSLECKGNKDKDDITLSINDVSGNEAEKNIELRVIVNKINVSHFLGASNVDIDSKDYDEAYFWSNGNLHQMELNNEIEQSNFSSGFIEGREKSIIEMENKNSETTVTETEAFNVPRDIDAVANTDSQIDSSRPSRSDVGVVSEPDKINETIITDIFDTVSSSMVNNESVNSPARIGDDLNSEDQIIVESLKAVIVNKKKKRKRKSWYSKKKKSSSKQRKSICKSDLSEKNQSEADLKITLNNPDDRSVENQLETSFNSSSANLTQIVNDSPSRIENREKKAIFPDYFYEQPTQEIDGDNNEIMLSTQVICENEPPSSSFNNNFNYSQAVYSQVATQVIPETNTKAVKSDEQFFRKPASVEVTDRTNFRTNSKMVNVKKSTNDTVETSYSNGGESKTGENKDKMDSANIGTNQQQTFPKTNLLRALQNNVGKDIYNFDDEEDDFLEQEMKIQVVKKENKKPIHKRTVGTNNRKKVTISSMENETVAENNGNSESISGMTRETDNNEKVNGKKRKNSCKKVNPKKEIENTGDDVVIDGDIKERNQTKSVQDPEQQLEFFGNRHRSLEIDDDRKLEKKTTDINGKKSGTEIPNGGRKSNKGSRSSNVIVKSESLLQEINGNIDQVEVKRRRGRPSKKLIIGDKENIPTKSEDGSSVRENVTLEKRKFEFEDKDCPSLVSKKKFPRQQSSPDDCNSITGFFSAKSQPSQVSIEYNEPQEKFIMFTGMPDLDYQKIISNLGGKIVDDSNLASLLVTDQVRRTLKFLSCLARGIPIVTPQWLNASKRCNSFVGTRSFIVKKNAKSFKMDLFTSISLAQTYQKSSGGIMAHHRCIVFVTDNTKPEPGELEKIIVSAGGKMLLVKDVSFYEHLNDTDSKHICIADVKDVNMRSLDLSARFRAMQEKNVEIVSVEFLLTMIMEQKWPQPDQYRIDVS